MLNIILHINIYLSQHKGKSSRVESKIILWYQD